MSTRRRRARKAQQQAKKEAVDRQQLRSLESTGVNAAHQKAERIQENLLEFVSKVDVSEGSKELLRNYASKSFILGYLQDEEVTELKWDLRIFHELYLDTHPGPESEMTGDVRAYVNDDPEDTLEPLRADQKLQVATFFQAIWLNVTRARDMKQQEILQTQIARSEVERGEEEDESWLPGV